MSFIKNMRQKWKKLTKDQWLILFLAGILLLVIALPMNCESGGAGISKRQEGSSEADETAAGPDGGKMTEDYERQLEKQLAEILSRMKGVGKVQVMITFCDTGETVVEKDTSYSSGRETTEGTGGEITEGEQTESTETTVYNPDSDEGVPFVSNQKLPVIEGVLIVAEGGEKKSVAENISEAVEALFGLEPHKIKVVEMNQVQEGSE